MDVFPGYISKQITETGQLNVFYGNGLPSGSMKEFIVTFGEIKVCGLKGSVTQMLITGI